MSTDATTSAAEFPKARRWGHRSRRIGAAIAGAAALTSALVMAYGHGRFHLTSVPAPETVEVDQGDVAVVLTENGLLESSDDAVIRCEVESFVGLPVGASAANFPAPPDRPKGSRIPGSAVVSSSSSGGPRIAPSAKAMAQARSHGEAGRSAGKNDTSGSGAGSKPPENTPEKRSAATGSSSGRAAPPDPGATGARPVIRSFDYVVAPHIPLRSMLPDQGVIATAPAPPPSILAIVPEGSHVKAADVVCELDASTFRDALQVQQIRYVQAKAWVDQARYILEANEIALREYEQGIFPQDVELVRQHIRICEIENDQAKRNFVWAQAAAAKGFRTGAQLAADASALEHTQIALRDAQGMLHRLVKHTGKRIKMARRAKIEAIRADLLSLQSAFQLEFERLKRIEAMIASCTMRAPRDGIVVYANRTNGWGSVELQIREGLTVYQSQPIFFLLDPRHMQVKAKINESQVARIRPGQPVAIHLEAFPDRPLRGSVAEITPIPSLASGPFSDVRTYYATVRIESGGFDALRTGLTAELEFQLETRRHVTRVPLQAIRRVGDRTFVALANSSATGLQWLWRPIEMGVTDMSFAEVVSGLAPGDRVIARSESLPAAALAAH